MNTDLTCAHSSANRTRMSSSNVSGLEPGTLSLVARRSRSVLTWIRAASSLLPVVLPVVLAATLATGCAVELGDGGSGNAPDPNALPSADERYPFGAEASPHETDRDLEQVDNTYNLPGIEPVETDTPPDSVPHHLLRVAESEPDVPARTDGSKPGDKPGAEDGGKKKPGKDGGDDDKKSAKPGSEPAKVSCKEASDCPIVANGCIVMACEIDAQGQGTCQEKAFVCQCLPGQDGSCDDNNPCTVDACSDVGECSHAQTQGCDDGNVCTEDACANTEVPGQPNLAVCKHKAALDTSCDDGDPCTGDSTCEAGGCAPGFYYGCDDGIECTFDICVAGKGCKHTPTAACGK